MNQRSCKDCDLEVFENRDKCILHCEKDDWFENLKLKEKYRIQRNDFFILLGKSFENIKGLNEDKANITQEDPFFYIKGDFNTPLENLKFPDVNFTDFEFWQYSDLYFRNCTFYGDFNIDLDENDKLILFDDCIFKQNLTAKKRIFNNDFFLNFCIVEGEFDLSESIFYSVCDCSSSKFNGQTDFKYTKFEKYISFRDCTFTKKVNLRDTIFLEKVNFLDVTARTRFYDEKEEKFHGETITINIANRETARIIKDSFEQQNNIIEANKFYALEMNEREKELDKDVKKGKNIFEWLVFKIHGLASNHSQDWTLSLLWIILISCIVTVFNQTYFYETDRYLFISLITTIPIGFAVFTKELIQKISLLIFTFIFIQLNAINWDFLANQLNPFSIMTGKEHLTFSGLIYKVIIAYLIYQLIISIRQNTRRK